tara:strand:- start:1544 stop:2938 length:1395 start_codon:yes stop_codon:yes gene_type:complete
MCGIGGVLHTTDNINNILYEILFNLQHRGQDSSGFISYDNKNNKTYQCREFGLVEKNLLNISNISGNMGIGHVRYPTHGIITKNEIQPFYANDFDGISLSHNGNITNINDIIKILDKNDISCISTSDSELILKYFILLLKTHISNINELNNIIIKKIIKKLYDTIRGSYSVIIMINNYGLVAFRDIYGIRPLVYSSTKDYISIASETIAFKENHNYNNIHNGEVVIFKNINNIEKFQIYNYPLTPCLFEYIYFARPESYINDVLVYEYREKIAEKIINMINSTDLNNIDCVVPVPQTGLISAMNVGQLLNKPIKHAIVKNRYTHRTFIDSDKTNIIKGIKKIKIIKKLVDNKNVLVIDDSIVRGNTSKYIIKELKKNNAKKIYFISCCPPIKNPNIYGIAIPTHEELIAYNKNNDEIEKELEVNKLYYLNLDLLCNTLTELNPNLLNFEKSVFTGHYITENNIK